MTLVGLDLNATRARAAAGPDGRPCLLTLEEAALDLPMALSLHGRHPEVGRAGTAQCREYPHLVCADFLAALGTPRTWPTGRRRLDAAGALALVFEHLRPTLGQARALMIGLPAYLTAAQAAQVAALARKARLAIAGTVSAPLAAARAAYAATPWSGAALVVDVDDHALTFTVCQARPDRLEVLDTQAMPRLALGVWKSCLLDAVAACCIRHSRRDPRDSGAAEQLLYDQLDAVFEAERADQQVEVIIRTASWCQNLFLQPEQVRAFCAPLAGQVVEEVGTAVTAALPESLAVLLVTAEAGRLPGLVPALQEAAGDPVPVHCLPPDAAARTAHELASRSRRGEPLAEYLDGSLLLPAAVPTPAGFREGRVGPRLAADR